jgi:peptide/nickel transport system permease protein
MIMGLKTEKKNAVSLHKKYKKKSFVQETWRRFKKNKGAMVCLTYLIILFTIVALSGVIYDYEADIIKQNLSERLQGPSLKHPLGTDQYGRDLLARIIYGGRFSLPVGFLSVACGFTIGLILGAIAGYFGGLTEEIIMRFADIIVVIPSMLLAILIIAILGVSVANLIFAIGISTIPNIIRITRASILTVRDQEYVEASLAIGANHAHIIKSHILPNCLSPIIVQVTLRIGAALVAASSLSYLGIGVQPPTPEWGALLSAGRAFIRDYGYMTLFPGLVITITVLAFNMVGDALRDALDPKLKN